MTVRGNFLKKIRLFLLLFILLGALGTGWADLIILKTGGRLEGSVLEETEENIQIEIEGMGVLNVDKENIERVIRQEIVRPPTNTPELIELLPTPTEIKAFSDLLQYSGMKDKDRPPTPTPEIILTRPRQPPPQPVEVEPTSTNTPVEEAPAETRPEQSAPRQEHEPAPWDDIESEEETTSPWDETGEEEEFDWEGDAYGSAGGGGMEGILSLIDGVSSTFGIIWQIVVIFLCIKIGEKKGNSTLFCVLSGFFFGIFGLIICSFEPPTSRNCFIACCVTELLIVIGIIIMVFVMGFALFAGM
jgi:hypothetical protein